MVKKIIYKLNFDCPLHIFAGGYGEENTELIIRSDTLFSSICHAADLLYGPSVVEDFINTNSINISSAFPFYDDEYFLPKPMNFLLPEFEIYSDQKAFKKVRFINNKLLENACNNNLGTFNFQRDHVINGCLFSKDKYNSMNKKDRLVYDTMETPRIITDRISNHTQLFNFAQVHFHKKAGLFFLADINTNQEKVFDATLRFLGDEGIGADRTIGKGQFSVEKTSLEMDLPQNGDDFLILSLYNPNEEELNAMQYDFSYWDLITREGWISGTDLRRKSLRMFAEGSVLSFSNNVIPKGNIRTVLAMEETDKLEHDIRRYGRAYTLPLAGRKNGNN